MLLRSDETDVPYMSRDGTPNGSLPCILIHAVISRCAERPRACHFTHSVNQGQGLYHGVK